MVKLLMLTLIAITLILAITQVVVPLFTDRDLFWMFRKKKPTPKSSINSSLERIKSKALGQKKALDSSRKIIKDTKDELDNLDKTIN